MSRHPVLLSLSILCATAACTGAENNNDDTTASSSSSSSSSGGGGSSTDGNRSSSSNNGGSTSSSGGSSGNAGNSSAGEASSSDMGGSSSSAQPTGPCTQSVNGYPVLFVCEYGNAAAGSRLVVSITGTQQLTERVSGQADVVTFADIDASAIGTAIYVSSSAEVFNSLDVQSPNEGRQGVILGCEGEREVLFRSEGSDPDTGYWLVKRNQATNSVESMRTFCNGVTAVDTPQ